MRYFNTDDIVQIGTPPGSAPVGALRVSGANAFALVAAIAPGLKGELLRERPRRSCRDCVVHLPLRPFGTPARGGGAGEKAAFPCPARVFLMPAPASYTREDVAEVHLPGSPPLLRAAMAALADAGAREAAPGEFTFRAFRNGRLTLGQAEAVEALISAGTAREKQRALARLGDRGAFRVREWREKLLDIAALLEAALDFSEEEPGEAPAADLAAMADELVAAGLERAADDGAAAEGAPHVALVGLANAGKSSLLNALLGFDAALVSPDASTTRDSLRHSVRWEGKDLLLSDNPGFDPETGGGGSRASAFALERLGGEDAACWVVDASRPPDRLDEAFADRLAARISGGAVLVLNKIDLPGRAAWDDVLRLADRKGIPVLERAEASAATGEGIPALRALLARRAGEAGCAEGWTRRESGELRAALLCCRAAAAELGGAGRLELAADDARRGVAAFSRALGEGYAEEALGRIFSRFCIGK